MQVKMALRMLIAGAGILLATTHLSRAAGGPESLPLQAFLDAQGQADVWYPPEPALFAWTGSPPDYPYMGWIDYAGVADRWLDANGGPDLGTTVTGTFTYQTVGPNLYEYSVNLHAKKALSWCVVAFDANGNWDGSTLLFGEHVYDVLAGATPALGDCQFKATWRQNADTPIADINLATNFGAPYRPAGWELRRITIRATADGPLHAAAGLGPEGTPGKLIIIQTQSAPQAGGNGNGNADWFPAEVVDLHAVGN